MGVALASAAALLGCLFVDLGSPTDQERWHWVIAVAVAAALSTGVLVAMGRSYLRPVLRAPLTGLFVGMVTAVILGGIAGAAEWISTGRVPTASLRAAVLAGLPGGAVLGLLIGLIAWAVFRLIPYQHLDRA